MAFACCAWLWVLLASCVANGIRMNGRIKGLTENHLDVNITSTALPFPKIYTKIMEPLRLLGTGSFGQAWLVKDLQKKSPRQGKLVVMKLLYIKDDRTNRDRYLTWEKASANKLLRKEVVAAAKECEISKMMQEEAERSDHPGAMRIMNCYGHNAPVLPSGKLKQVTGKAAKRPLYLLLENCGATDLTKFMRQKARHAEVDLPLVQNLYKQLMQGLSFLRQLPNPWVHHDLKPDNIVVKTQDDGTYSLHLIDFGASTETTSSKRSKMTPSTLVYAPNEWGIDGNFGWCPGDHSSKPDGNCGTAFDIFSAGAIFVELLTGSRLYSMPGFYDKRREELNFQTIETVAKNTDKFAAALSKHARSDYKTTTSEFVSTLSNIALPVIASQLSVQPYHRPTADYILDSGLLSHVRTPDDIDYMALKRQREAVAEAAASGENVGSVTMKYLLGEKVLVWSNTAEETTGQGWCVGHVNELRPGKQVLVVFELDGHGYEKELEDSSEFLRPYVEDVEDEEDGIDSDNEFNPASGSKAGGLLADEAYEEENSKCPSWCDECDIAMNDKGSLQGHRRTHFSKWASICYVDMLKKIRHKNEGHSEGGAVCSEGPTLSLGKRKFQTYLCQDLDLLDVKPEYGSRGKPDNWVKAVVK